MIEYFLVKQGARNMLIPTIISGIIFLVLAIISLASYICFSLVFKTPKRKILKDGEYDFPPGDIYEPFYPQMKIWTDDIRSRKRELCEVKSFDGLTLRGYYYEFSPDSPLELIFHGYSGNAERDLSGAVERCSALDRSCLLIDQRGAGMSDGKVCSFGVNERHDCLSWIEFARKKFGESRPIIIGGISMGAATVMMASGEKLPDNVVCVMADCGYSSQKDIICKVVKEMKLPPKLIYPFIKLGAQVYGGFDLEEVTPLEAVAKSKTPIVFLHGDTDDFVPHSMSVDCYNACQTTKKLITIEGAGHGLAFPLNPQKYVEGLREFQYEANLFKK